MMHSENSNNEYNFKKHQKHKSHEKRGESKREINSNILIGLQQGTNENNKAVLNETESYNNNSVKKGIINLKMKCTR